ncbi:trace amine-associated receptor 9-like [Sinocyclocheilus anshuiensis]|uniref:trace amine-associated receptor 9-like n=1 Tax=Sinocyclocheilus anshuiensis TaxID=1608454 RepID=UPI0007BA34CD|nr:PREDICTED: trace amine-associated receptor 9-like [Sinocyclocheilus anshuiensis]
MNLTAMNQSDVCQEYWCPERSVSLSVYVILYVAAAAVSLLTVCGNLLVIISVSHFKQLHTPANILILSLAVCDLLVGVFVLPFHLSWLIESCWISGSVMCSVFNFVTFQATSVSVHTVALIAVDRFLALSSPFLYSEKISPTVICIATLFNWLFSQFYNFTLLYVNGNFADVTCPGMCIAVIDGVSSLIDLLFVFLMPCTLIIILYTHVFVIAKKHATDRFYVRNVTVIFFFLNSTINPIIYALFYPWFQKSLKLIFTFKVLNKDSSLMNLLKVTE